MENEEERIKIIKQLREETGWGMMDCKKALYNSSWDIEKAKKWLIDYEKNNKYKFL